MTALFRVREGRFRAAHKIERVSFRIEKQISGHFLFLGRIPALQNAVKDLVNTSQHKHDKIAGLLLRHYATWAQPVALIHSFISATDFLEGFEVWWAKWNDALDRQLTEESHAAFVKTADSSAPSTAVAQRAGDADLPGLVFEGLQILSSFGYRMPLSFANDRLQKFEKHLGKVAASNLFDASSIPADQCVQPN